MEQQRLLFICYDFPPRFLPTAIRASKLIEELKKNWSIKVLTSVSNPLLEDSVSIDFIKSWTPQSLLLFLQRIKMHKLVNLLLWPDEGIFWILPAVFKAKSIVKHQKISAIVVFMMPYSTGLVGILMKWLTGLPLLLNFDDSYTCTDMNSNFVTWIHYKMSIWLEDFYIKRADAVVYVSKQNLSAVRNRQPPSQRCKFHLVRYGADPKDFTLLDTDIKSTAPSSYHIVYIGGMVGWFEFYPRPKSYFSLKTLLAAWNKLGIYELAKLDVRSHSPIFVGQAVKQAIDRHPEWQGKIKVKVYGSTYPKSVTDYVLESQGIADVVEVYDVVPHTEAIKLATQADLLFLTLPDRPDGSPGGRISAKTYEYLMTNKPILAAVPPGENWDYLNDKPGVWLVKPTDISTMTNVITELVSTQFSGQTVPFNRKLLYPELSYTNRAKEFNEIIEKIVNFPEHRVGG